MNDKVNYTLVGAFVLVLGAALVGAVLWLAAGFDAKGIYDPYESIVEESVAGLSIAAPVKYLGVDVGKVSEIGINPDNTRQVRIRFMIKRGTPVKQDTDAMLKSQGLTGIAYIELSAGTAGSPALVVGPEGKAPRIRSTPSLSARLEDVLTSALAKLNRTTASLDAVLDPANRAALKSTLADTASLVHALSAQSAVMSAGIADAARTTRWTAEAGAKLGPAIDRIVASADAVARMADEARDASIRTGKAMDQASSGIQQINTGALPDTVQLIAELKTLATSLRELSEQTERAPNSLLLGAPARASGPGEGAQR